MGLYYSSEVAWGVKITQEQVDKIETGDLVKEEMIIYCNTMGHGDIILGFYLSSLREDDINIASEINSPIISQVVQLEKACSYYNIKYNPQTYHWLAYD